MEGNELKTDTTENFGGVSDLLAEIEEKKTELAQLNAEIENKKAEMRKLTPASEQDILYDVEDVKIIYKSFSLDRKKYDREELLPR